MFFGYIILLTALTISAVAEFYSIMGLLAIFPAAFWPIIIMGATLALGKIVATVWLKENWHRIGVMFKLYLIPAIIVLMLLTSIGCFGFLSKAHSDQSLNSGDIQAKIAVYDVKLKIENDNIVQYRISLAQLNAGVDSVLDRSTSERGAARAISIRKSQAADRKLITDQITAAQTNIAQISQERAPIAAETRRLEAEVGPIKYIAALVYGETADRSSLERAVSWVIILIVCVFDPLALTLILASTRQFAWAHEDAVAAKQLAAAAERDAAAAAAANPVSHGICTTCQTELQLAPGQGVFCPNVKCGVMHGPPVYTSTGPLDQFTPPAVVKKPRVKRILKEKKIRVPRVKKVAPAPPAAVIPPPEQPVPDATIETPELDVITDTPEQPVLDVITEPQSVTTSDDPDQPADLIEVIQEVVDPVTRVRTKMHSWVPDNRALADGAPPQVRADFGAQFPPTANKGDIYLRVDFLPTKLFKFNGVKWMEVDKQSTDSYAYNQEYIKYLIDQLASGEYDTDNLTETEQDQIKAMLNK
jgi:hypothetical protein